jgi:hypothetical protein
VVRRIGSVATPRMVFLVIIELISLLFSRSRRFDDPILTFVLGFTWLADGTRRRRGKSDFQRRLIKIIE